MGRDVDDFDILAKLGFIEERTGIVAFSKQLVVTLRNSLGKRIADLVRSEEHATKPVDRGGVRQFD